MKLSNKPDADNAGIALAVPLSRLTFFGPACLIWGRWTAMRTLIAFSWLLLLGPTPTFAGGGTNEFTLFKHQARRQAYEWRISEARILATPEWNMGVTTLPLSPDRAWQITKHWFSKQDGGEPDFVRMEIRSFDPSGTSAGLRRRFFYRIECIPAQFDSMVVVVLLDGTVVEPKRIPNLRAEEIK